MSKRKIKFFWANYPRICTMFCSFQNPMNSMLMKFHSGGHGHHDSGAQMDDFNQRTLAAPSFADSGQNNNGVLLPPPAYAPVMGLDQLLAGAMRLATVTEGQQQHHHHLNEGSGGGGGQESANNTWDGRNSSLNSAVDGAFQKAMNGQGDYAFVRFL
jgi:hypothetical protein